MGSRRPLDFYQSGDYQVRALLWHQAIGGVVLECCVGDGSIANIIRPRCTQMITNDIDPKREADFHLDAAAPSFHSALNFSVDWVVSNPPYAMPQALQIVQNAWEMARVGVAMQLRLSFKEPTKLRGPWLRDHPISRELTLPRHSFTGDGKSDNTTTSWFIWLKPQPSQWTRVEIPGVTDDGTFNDIFNLDIFNTKPLPSHVSLFDAERLFRTVPKDTE